MRFAIREYYPDSNHYGEAFEIIEGETLTDFEAYVDGFCDRSEEAVSNPFDACAARDFTIDDRPFTAFAYEE